MTFNAADRVGVVGGYIGGIGQILNMLGNGFGGNGYGCNNGMAYGAYGCSDNMAVNRYELGMEKDLAAKDSKISLLESTIYTDGKLNDLRNYVDRRFDKVDHDLGDQKAFNAGTISTINCMRGDIGELLSLTKRIIPKDSICPEYMQRYNSWVAPTTTAQETTAGG